jgi:hypothetical protein
MKVISKPQKEQLIKMLNEWNTKHFSDLDHYNDYNLKLTELKQILKNNPNWGSILPVNLDNGQIVQKFNDGILGIAVVDERGSGLLYNL